MRAPDVADLLQTFIDDGDESATKSRELVLMLLQCGSSPFSRDHFTPGHITCTAMVLSPDRRKFLLVHHRRLDRWLLPGGHVESSDVAIWDTARREAMEETGVELLPEEKPLLVGIDVHGIPAKRKEPYHLHHDLVFRFQATTAKLTGSEETRDVAWASVAHFDKYDLPVSIRRCVLRAIWGW